MKPFHSIAVPHKDILEGRLTLDIYAADLWAVSQNKGPEEYRNAELFFRKTYSTQGLESLMGIVENRLKGKGGDPIIQIQTPFGGGKTHSLIAMYHKAKEWGAKPVALVGDKLKTGRRAEEFDTLWGLMEMQLTGSRKTFDSPIPPGGDQIIRLLERHSPVLILADELISYLNVADAVTVENTTLTSLTYGFWDNLAKAVTQISGVSMVYTTTPSNPYNKSPRGQEIVSQLQNITGRVEIIRTPVNDDEIAHIIRRRLFTDIKETQVKEIVAEYSDYAEKENILPSLTELSEYRKKFAASYPFMPEVIDVLYQRWGSYSTFQRTRGLLRLLSLVVHSLKEKNLRYISLADFDLNNQEIRQELLKHIGEEFNGVIASDITGDQSGSEKVNNVLGDAFRGLTLGTRTASAIFLYSFSGGGTKGATLAEIKRSATTLDNPSSVISEVLDQLKSRLFYLQTSGDACFFNSQPNLNRILLTKMENVKDDELVPLEKDLIRESLEKDVLKSFIWEESSGNIPDSESLHLVILKQGDQEIIRQILSMKGQTPRVHKNTLFFLYPPESERHQFSAILKRRLAYESIQKDKKNLQLSKDQEKEVKDELNKIKSGLKEAVRNLYHTVAVPDKEDSVSLLDLGKPVHGKLKALNREVYDSLRADGKISEKIEPIVIREKYLSGKDHVSTANIYKSTLKTPGEIRLSGRSVLEQALSKGVEKGLFGLGELKDNQPVCQYFKETPCLAFSEHEVLISESLCVMQSDQKQENKSSDKTVNAFSATGSDSTAGSVKENSDVKKTAGRGTGNPGDKKELKLRFQVPQGKVSSIMGAMNFLQTKFKTLEINLAASNGSISEQEYKDKIIECFEQSGIQLQD